MRFYNWSLSSFKKRKCHFLAVDFDAKHTNSDFKAKVKAFIDTCKSLILMLI